MDIKDRYVINFQSTLGKKRSDIEIYDKETHNYFFIDLKYDNSNEKVKATKIYNEMIFTEEYYQQLYKILELIYSKKTDKELYNELKDIKFENFLNILIKDNKSIDFIKQYIINNNYSNDIKVIDFVTTKYTNQLQKGVFAENLKYYSELRGYTPSDIAKKLEYPVSTVNDWYNGVSKPAEGKIRTLANLLYVSPRELKEPRKGLDNCVKEDEESYCYRIPVLGTIPAGIPNEAIQYIDDWEEIPKAWANSDKDFFALKIRGNSMYDTYHDGDIVIFERANKCESGKNCAVMIDNCDVTFKKLIQTDAGIILQPLNEKDFEPIFYNKKQVIELNIKVIGIPRELRRQNSL